MSHESFSFVVGLAVGAFVISALYEAMYWRKAREELKRLKR